MEPCPWGVVGVVERSAKGKGMPWTGKGGREVLAFHRGIVCMD